jgi:hypothetical protein
VAGPHTLSVTGPVSGTYSFTVVPSIDLNATAGLAGSLVTVTGYDFASRSTVTIKFDGNTVATTESDGDGLPRPLPYGVTFTVPNSTTGNYTVTATDGNGNSASVTFTVAPVPSISLTPTSGNVGSSVTVSGSNFAANSSLTVNAKKWSQLPGVPVTLGSATTDSAGSFSANFTVPASVTLSSREVIYFIPGIYTVAVTDASGNSVSAYFTVIASASSTATASGHSATVDMSATTGVNVTVSGSSLQDDTRLTAASTNYDDDQPLETGTVSVSGGIFYDVHVASGGGALSSDVSVAVSISDPDFTSVSVMEYWNGSSWVFVATTFTAPHTVSGTIPASALTGTPVVVGTPKSSAPPLLTIIVIVVAVVVILGMLFVYVKRRKAKKTAPQSTPTSSG